MRVLLENISHSERLKLHLALSTGLVMLEQGGSGGSRGMKVLCPPLNDINEAHKVAPWNFLESSMSKVLPLITWSASL